MNVIHHRGNTMGRRRSGVGGKKERKREERKRLWAKRSEPC